MCENQVRNERNDDGNHGILEIASSQPEDLGFSFWEQKSLFYNLENPLKLILSNSIII